MAVGKLEGGIAWRDLTAPLPKAKRGLLCHRPVCAPLSQAVSQVRSCAQQGSAEADRAGTHGNTEWLQLLLQGPTGKTAVTDIKYGDGVAVLQDLFYHIYGVPRELQLIVSGFKVLPGQLSLRECGLTHMSTVSVHLRLRGGDSARGGQVQGGASRLGFQRLSPVSTKGATETHQQSNQSLCLQRLEATPLLSADISQEPAAGSGQSD